MSSLDDTSRRVDLPLMGSFTTGAIPAPLGLFLEPAAEYGIHPPLPLSDAQVDGEGVLRVLSVPSASSEAPLGRAGALLALQWIAGMDLNPLCSDMDKTYSPEVFKACGSRSVVTVCAGTDTVREFLHDAVHALRLSTLEASHRQLSNRVVSDPIPDELSGFGESTPRTQFISGWMELLPQRFRDDSDFDRSQLLSSERLDALVRTFYSCVPSEKRPRLANVDHVHEADKRLSASDISVVVLASPRERGISEGGFPMLRPLIESLLPYHVPRASFWERLVANDASWATYLERTHSEQAERLKHIPKFSLDQIRQVIALWGASLQEHELRSLWNFLNGVEQPSDVNVLQRVLVHLLSHYRVYARRTGRRVGSSSGAVVLYNQESLPSQVRALIAEVQSAEVQTSKMQSTEVPIADAANLPLFLACDASSSLDQEQVAELALAQWGLPFADLSFSLESDLSGHPRAVAEYLTDLLQGFEALADRAYRRSGRIHRFSDDATDRLALDPAVARDAASGMPRLFPHQKDYCDRVTSAFGVFPRAAASPNGLLSPDCLDAVGNFSARAEALSQHFFITSVAAPLQRRSKDGTLEEIPYSSLRHLLRGLLPRPLADRFRRWDRHRERWVEVNTLYDHWRSTFGEFGLSLAAQDDVLGRDFLEGAPLLTQEHLEAHGLLGAWGFASEDIPLVLDVLQGRVRESSDAVKRVVERLFYHYNTLICKEAFARGDRDSASLPRRRAGMVWNPYQEEIDSDSMAFLQQHLKKVEHSPDDCYADAPLLVVALPDVRADAMFGIRLLSARFDQALDKVVAGLNQDQPRMDMADWREVERCGAQLADHPNVIASQQVLQAGFQRLLSLYGVASIDAFWTQNVERRTGPAPQPLSPLFERFGFSFLTLFLRQGTTSLRLGRYDGAQVALSYLDGAHQYLDAVFGRADFNPNAVLEGKRLLPLTDRVTQFLLDACLVGQKHPRFSNKKVAAMHYRDTYYRLVGGQALAQSLDGGHEASKAVFAAIPLGAYAEAVCLYLEGKPSCYEAIVALGERILLAETNVPYDQRFLDFLEQYVPAMMGAGAESSIGLPGFAPLELGEASVRVPLAIMTLEALFRLSQADPSKQGDDDSDRSRAMFDRLIQLFPRLVPHPGRSAAEGPVTFWDYQLLLKLEHYAREVLGDLDRAEVFRLEAAKALSHRDPYDPERLRVSFHFVQEIERVRFDQIFNKLRLQMKAGISPSDDDLNASAQALIKALSVERQLLAALEAGPFRTGSSVEVYEGKILEARSTEFQLLILLKAFLLFLDPIFASKELPVGVLFLHEEMPAIPILVANIDDELRRVSASLKDLLASSSHNYGFFWTHDIVLRQSLKPAVGMDIPGVSAFFAPFLEDWTAFAAERFPS